MSRTRLTANEIEAILCVAGDAIAHETIASCFEEHERDKVTDAFHNGMDKLARMLGDRERSNAQKKAARDR